jgi:hypothetical protein
MMYINKNILIELCASNYATSNDRVNEIDKIFKTSMTYNEKIIIQIMFHKHLIATLTRYTHTHTITLNQNKH